MIATRNATGLTVELEVTQHEGTSTQIRVKHVPLPWALQQRGRVLLLAADNPGEKDGKERENSGQVPGNGDAD